MVLSIEEHLLYVHSDFPNALYVSSACDEYWDKNQNSHRKAKIVIN
jgi:hypothetical protein